MARCTRCGWQTDDGAEFCSGCGDYPDPAVADRPLTAPAMTAAADYLRPFAAEEPALPEPASWDERRSGRPWQDQGQQPPVASPSGQLPDSGWPAPAGRPSWRRDAYGLAPASPLDVPARPPSGDQYFVPAPSPPSTAQSPWAAAARPGQYYEQEGRIDGNGLPGGYPAAGWPAQHEVLPRPDLDGPLAPPEQEPEPGQPPAAAEPAADSGRLARRQLSPPGDSELTGSRRAGGPQRNGRWVSFAAAGVVVIMAAAIVTILLAGHGKPASKAGSSRAASTRAPLHSSAPKTPPAAGNSLVAVAPQAAGSPATPAVVSFLTRYFTAINRHSYPAYRRLFAARLRGGLSAAAFRSGYGSSQDSQATLRSITAAGAGQVAAAVTFTSHQQAAASPTGSTCTAWSISLYLVRQGSQYVIESPPAGYSARSSTCS